MRLERSSSETSFRSVIPTCWTCVIPTRSGSRPPSDGVGSMGAPRRWRRSSRLGRWRGSRPELNAAPVLGTLVPKMPLDRELIRQVRTLDEYDLRRLMIFARGLLVSRQGREFEGPAPAPRGKVTFRQESVKCGRRNCARCPHGPYWYAYWRERGRLRSRYIGKQLPSVPAHAVEPQP
jgi:hypothetical protein